MEEQQLHLNVGLAKIQETVEQVEELQASLSVKKIELEKKNALANQKLKQMVSESFFFSAVYVPVVEFYCSYFQCINCLRLL